MLTESDMGAPVATKRPARRKLPWGFLISGAAIIAAVVYLVIANTGATAEYYMTIHQLRTCSSCAGKTVRVAGFVAPSGLAKDDATQTVRFTITDNTLSMPVVYKGIVPDAFKPGAQVVVEGTYASGMFQASTVLAKCPSKFQAATPGATGGSSATGK
ncbi:MAG TPA: cytochrome c maturation protein CcmE [Ktedonobacterales bacterium]